ncbi:AraC family transcriptional regulator [Sphingobacterium suaedae]|uniref:AraC family transcriptional regulator n=1 Tax=Sphingobacterium suaedae TaxID=1686402 RepID=A0ABW5KBL7_9SPHI
MSRSLTSPSSEYFPVFNIQKFDPDHRNDRDVLFHKLYGERLIESPHKHDFFIIMLFRRGEGLHMIDFAEYTLGDYQIHLVFPDQVHQWHIFEQTEAYQLMIRRPVFERISSSFRYPSMYYQQHPVMQLTEPTFQTLLQEFKAIEQEIQHPPVLWELVQARCQVVGLLISKIAERTFKDFDIFRSVPVISKLIHLVEQHYKVQHTVSFYADLLHISANYLNVLCRKHASRSASHFIQDRILLEAKRLLKASDLTFKQIAFDLGFYDHANFSKFFKTHTNMTPTAFREQK